jgi:hypothetical protein
MASARNGHEVARLIAHFGRQGDLGRNRRSNGAVGSKKTVNGEGIMERNQRPRPAGDRRHGRGEVELDRRYGEIGISAVAAAARYHGDRQDEREPEPHWALVPDSD